MTRPPASAFERAVADQPRAYRRLVTEGPAAWESALAACTGPGRRYWLVGMGSSYFAACGVAAAWRRYGLPAEARLASECLYDPPPWAPSDVLVAVSQSGRSVETVKLLQGVDGDELVTVAVTRDADSPLARRATCRLVLDVPADEGVAVRSFGASLLALLYLGWRLGGGTAAAWVAEALRLTDALQDAMTAAPEWRALGQNLAPVLRAGVTLARGGLSAAAREAALLLNEVAKLPCWYEEAAEFRHGVVECADPNVLVALFAAGSEAFDAALCRELARTGARVIATAPASVSAVLRQAGAHAVKVPDLPADLTVLAHVLPWQWIALGLAEARAIPPGRFRYIGPVIAQEPGESRAEGGGSD